MEKFDLYTMSTLQRKYFRAWHHAKNARKPENKQSYEDEAKRLRDEMDKRVNAIIKIIDVYHYYLHHTAMTQALLNKVVALIEANRRTLNLIDTLPYALAVHHGLKLPDWADTDLLASEYTAGNCSTEVPDGNDSLG